MAAGGVVPTGTPGVSLIRLAIRQAASKSVLPLSCLTTSAFRTFTSVCVIVN